MPVSEASLSGRVCARSGRDAAGNGPLTLATDGTDGAEEDGVIVDLGYVSRKTVARDQEQKD